MTRLVIVNTILFIFLISKITIYSQLDYTSDFFTMLELSRSWFRDGTFMFEPAFGFHAAIHGYYFMLLFYPFTLMANGYGVIVAFFLLLFITAYYARKLSISWTVWFFLVSPAAYWIYDDFIYGFHCELLYLPLGILLAISVALSNRVVMFIVAAGMMLIKEDAPILIWSILSASLIFTNESNKEILKKFLIISLVCGVLFLINLSLLSLLNVLYSEAETKGRMLVALTQAVNSIKNGQFNTQFFSLFHALLLISSLFILCPIRAIPKVGFVFIITSIPLFAISFIGAMHYDPTDSIHTITWPPRIVTVLTLFISCTIFASQQNPSLFFSSKYLVYTQILIIVALQSYVLSITRGYEILDRLQPFRHFRHTKSIINYISKNELAFLDCLAHHTSGDISVLTEPHLFALFEHTKMLWPNRSLSKGMKPDLLVCALEGRYPFPVGCMKDLQTFMNENEEKLISEMGNFRIYTIQNHIKKNVELCLSL